MPAGLHAVGSLERREVSSTRTLIAAGALMSEGLTYREAALAAIVGPLTYDPELREVLIAVIDAYAGGAPGPSVHR